MVTSCGFLKEEASSNTDNELSTAGSSVGDELGKKGWNVKLMAEGANDEEIPMENGELVSRYLNQLLV